MSNLGHFIGLMKNFVMCSYCWDSRIPEAQRGTACGYDAGHKECIQNFGGEVLGEQAVRIGGG
jgi:hypothetical protein